MKYVIYSKQAEELLLKALIGQVLLDKETLNLMVILDLHIKQRDKDMFPLLRSIEVLTFDPESPTEVQYQDIGGDTHDLVENAIPQMISDYKKLKTQLNILKL